jgi:hypothetical protein
MDYPDRKPRPKRSPRDIEEGRKEPELRLAEYAAPCGEEYPWRTFGEAFPELEVAQRPLKPPRGRMH